MKGRKAPQRIERRDVLGERPALDGGTIRGLAIPFNSWTTIGYGPMSFRERVGSGSVTKTLGEADIVLLDNHDTARPIARTSAGTLRLTPTATRGVDIDADPADTTYARDCVENVRAGNYGGMSFGFEVIKDSWAIGDDGVDERTLNEIKLHEVSICTFPAYGDTEIGMRDRYDAAMEAKDRFYESRGQRAAKASYSDLHVCGECGSKSEYGSYCGACGEAMYSPESTPNDYCTSCGSEMPASARASHVCEQRKGSKKPYGDVPYADPKNGKYPIDAEHVKAAWSYINQEKNAAEYPLNGVTLAEVKARIKAAMKKFGHDVSEDDRDAGTPEERAGQEYKVMQQALEHLAGGDHEAARAVIQEHLDNAAESDADQGDDDENLNESDNDHMVAHSTQAGAAVPVREAERLYELIRTLPVTKTSNEALAILEPLLSTPEERDESPKPEPSTSGIALDSDEGIELQKRMKALKDNYRP